MGLLLDVKSKSKKIHEVKARKHITLMMIPDPTKSAKVVKIPKLPIFICCIVLIAFVIGGAGYVLHLRQQVVVSNLHALSTSTSINDKDTLIAKLESANNEHYKQLQQLRILATDLDGKVKELETYKQEMNSKLNSTDSAPIPQQKEFILDAAKTMNAFAQSAEPETNQIDNQIIRTFEVEVDRLSTSLESTLSMTTVSIGDYRQLNTKLDALIPAWEACPMGSPLASIVINDKYGWRSDPINGRTEFHTGIDLKAKCSPVYATGNGKVVTSEYESGYGYTVVIDHGYGYKTLYAHNSELLVEVGDAVLKGAQVAVSGSSGRVTGAHLHYEVLYNGETMDPINYIF
ncbi:MAG: hypothetical protein CVU84_17010 [Firmicutes bacterium HGW-Firmicutes-1]|jgi:murein DD-endopeptidase MepM/ murein hydrolase activator NlpD|nr:MAG: hypothetical protein CVU84_17010 [Firmicutes bacterium HGW-Firmicutes-1]